MRRRILVACVFSLVLVVIAQAATIQYTDHVARKTIHFPAGMILTTDDGESITVVAASGYFDMEGAYRWDAPESASYTDMIVGSAVSDGYEFGKFDYRYNTQMGGIGRFRAHFRNRFYFIGEKYDGGSNPVVYFGEPGGQAVEMTGNAGLSAVTGVYSGWLSSPEYLIQSVTPPTCSSTTAGLHRNGVALCYCNGSTYELLSASGSCPS